MKRKKIIIMGAAGRDFHNFNVYFRDNDEFEVVCFTATQIPDIHGRKYPVELAGKLYPDGIPIYDEKELSGLIKQHEADKVVFSYSDVPHSYVMDKASIVNAAGADFVLLSPKNTMLKSKKPVISICAVRTGCGKSQTTRRVCEILQSFGKKVSVIRHPMPYGDLAKQIAQRFADYEDLDRHECTIEEREEYEPHIDRGFIVYAGVDYQRILDMAEQESDIILWDGGNNDFSFYESDFYLVVADPHRAGHELSYYPGEINFLMADAILINKMDTADKENVDVIMQNIRAYNPNADVLKAESPVTVSEPEKVKGKRVLVVEDGPTLTHGGMKFGAGVVAAKKLGASELVDPRPFAVNSIASVYEKYAHLDALLPAMGYGADQVKDLEDTINRIPCDLVVIGTPIDLTRVVNINKPSVRVKYDLKEISKPDLETLLQKFK